MKKITDVITGDDPCSIAIRTQAAVKGWVTVDQVTELKLRDKTITDVSPLAGLTNLETVDITATSVVDASVLCELPALTRWSAPAAIMLDADNNFIR